MPRYVSRRTVLHGAAALGSMGLVGAPAWAQSAGILERMRKAGVAKIGITQTPPWSEVRPDGTLSGIGPDVVQQIMVKLGVPKLEAVTVTYAELIPGMMAGRWDFVAACLSVSKARCAQVNFCSPINFDELVVSYVAADMPNPPASMAEIGKRGLKVGMVSGGYSVPLMRSLTATDNISLLPDNAALVDGLLAKRYQVAVGQTIGMLLVRKNKPGFEMTAPLTDTNSGGSGPAFRLTDADLFEPFDAEVRALKKSGEIARINEKYDAKYIRDRHDNIHGKEACEISI